MVAAPWLVHISDAQNASFVIKLPGKNDHIDAHDSGPFHSIHQDAFQNNIYFGWKIGRIILYSQIF
jgi:hypothetical protein